MWVLPLVGYIGLVLGFCFLTLAIASGLYYLSELVEEHTVAAKKLLAQLIYGIITIQILLLVLDRLPLLLSLLSVASHAIYLQNLRYFPIVRLTDPIFLTSCVLVAANHYLWFQHFSIPPDPRVYTATSSSGNSYRTTGRSIYDPPPQAPTFTEIASFFFVQVWLVPFALFVSLSAGENVLPSMGSEMATAPDSALAARSRSMVADAAAAAATSVGGLRVSGMLTPRSASREPTTRSEGGTERAGSGDNIGLGFPDQRRRGRRKTNKGLVRVAVDGVRGWVSESGEVMGLWKGDRTRDW